jgi:hypothetical protein
VGDNARAHLLKLHNDTLKFGQTIMDQAELEKAKRAEDLPGLADLAAEVDESSTPIAFPGSPCSAT